MKNDIKESKKAIMNKNIDWLGRNEGTRVSQKVRTEKGKEEQSQNKIQKESNQNNQIKSNIIKQKNERYKQEEN